MDKKNIHIKWFLGGILLISYAAFVKITGKFLIHENYLSLFLDREPNPFYYYFNLYGSLSLGILVFYRSLIFIPSNKKFLDEHPEYKRKMYEYRRAQMEINPQRLMKIVLTILALFALLMMILKLFI